MQKHSQHRKTLMHTYSISVGNPEGTDFTICFEHDKEFTKEEFDKISEDAIVYALEICLEKNHYTTLSQIDTQFIIEYMSTLKFSTINETARYYLEPYWKKENIKSEKLRQWIDREDINDTPKYLKEEEQ